MKEAAVVKYTKMEKDIADVDRSIAQLEKTRDNLITR